jgi:hypothetical protein
MSNTCQTCADWTGRICEGSGPYRYKLTGAGWTCPCHRESEQGFAAFLAKLYPVSGPGRGGRRKLAHALGLGEMRISHWIAGHTVPNVQMAGRIAEVLGKSVESIEDMILVDVRRRAEKNWRSGGKEE